MSDKVRKGWPPVLAEPDEVEARLASGVPIWVCRWCGPHLTSRANWCDAGCGSDYNRMDRWLPEVEDPS